MSPPSRASEFPNDNPSLSEGAIWICPEVRSRARSWLRPVFAPSADPRLITVSGAELPELAVEREPKSQPGPELDGFAGFVAALADVAQAHGASRAAACLPELLGAAPYRAGALGAELEKALAERGILSPSGGKKSDAFEETSSAWRRVLSGEADDLSCCGTTTLDRFGAEVLAALLGAPKTRIEELRRELRRRGVAAFGIIANAA